MRNNRGRPIAGGPTCLLTALLTRRIARLPSDDAGNTDQADLGILLANWGCP